MRRLILITTLLALGLFVAGFASAERVNLTIYPQIGTTELGVPVHLGGHTLDATIGSNLYSRTTTYTNGSSGESANALFVGGRYHMDTVPDLDTYLMGRAYFYHLTGTATGSYPQRAVDVGLGIGYDLSAHLSLVGETGVEFTYSRMDDYSAVQNSHFTYADWGLRYRF